MSEEKLPSMEEEAIKRKERLKALKRNVQNRQSDTAATGDQTEDHKKPKFRSYKPQDEALKEIATITPTEPVDIEAEVQSQLELLRTPIVIDEIDIANLAPRKPDWDLKRDVSKKLEKLELRTQRAIAELIRVRLRSSEPTNMLEGVNVAAAVSTSKLIRPVEGEDVEEA